MARVVRAPIVLGLLWAVAGFALAAGGAGVVRVMTGNEFWDLEVGWSVGYPVALLGWLAGVGGWSHWGREWFGLEARPYALQGWQRYFGFSPDHKVIGVQYTVTTFVFNVRNVPAALYKALGGFATNGVNMTKLESYMVGGRFAATQFYADVEAHPQDRPLELALEELAFFSHEVKILGVYPAHLVRIAVREEARGAP